jgi:hypothetical protein
VTLTADSHRLTVGAIALGALVLLALGLAASLTSLLPWPLVVLAGLYAWTLGGGSIDQWSPVYAAGLLAVAELAYWSLELRGRAQDAERLIERRTALVATLTLVAIGAGALVLAATALPIGSGVPTDLLGAAAAVAAVAVFAALARPRA